MEKYVRIKFPLMPSEKDKILKFDRYMKSDKMPCINYTDIEFLI